MTMTDTAVATLSVRALNVSYGKTTIVSDVDLDLFPGETLALVGGSGAGKSTVAKAIAGLVKPSAGRIMLDRPAAGIQQPESSETAIDLLTLSRKQARAVRRSINLVMQDPYTSLPPHRPVAETVMEPLKIHRIADRAHRLAQMRQALDAVGLAPDRYAKRYPHELSGGERQRVAFARAIISQPRVILADEPTGMLDASMRAEVSSLMTSHARDLGTAFLHISHDLALATHTSDRVAVMHNGRIVEQGPCQQLLNQPCHPTTQRLLDVAFRGLRRVQAG